MPDYRVIRTKHNGYESADFKLDRPLGTDDYLLLHFKTPVTFTLGDQAKHVTPGECILLSPGTPHAFFPDGCDLVHDWMHFVPLAPDLPTSWNLPTDTFFRPVETGFITTLIKACELELIDRREGFEDMISLHVSELMIRLRRSRHVAPRSLHSDALYALRFDMYRNPDRYLSSHDMADRVGLSRSRFAVVYKQVIGTPPKSDLIQARVSKASHLLSLGTLSLNEISETCGYTSVYHFIRQFRTVTGTTPGQYRKNR